jgi:hypothetical protein
LRKERELSFYGDIDFVPTEEYSNQQAQKALSDTEWLVDVARRAVEFVT